MWWKFWSKSSDLEDMRDDMEAQADNESTEDDTQPVIDHIVKVTYNDGTAYVVITRYWENPEASATEVYKDFYVWFTEGTTPWFELKHDHGSTMIKRDILKRVEFIRKT